ncbi:helix-turn-helix domain-containing protein [Kitasatospora sp. NPDC056076]|uniref:helix-turn-helix domain-containing protein n=1 Tax=Kitasatospora sp. NPDC056076 TaxID=3345703 RepID=UPI0035E250A7
MPGRQLGPVTDEVRAEILRLHAENLSRNEIMRRVDRSARTVTETVHDAGLTFARSAQVVAATNARQADNKDRRTRAVQRLYDRVERIQDRLAEDEYRYQHVTHTGMVVTVSDEYPPASDEKHLAGAVTGYLNAAARLEAIDAGTGADDALSMLGALAAGIARYAEEDTGGEG